ncbi:MAG: GAF domain-containing protein, partial [Ignavibacteriales bacterium]|nr:GAF domain-containing protein [Ignavibacteriales bacterium]
MATIQTKLKKAFLIAASTTLLVIVFILDIIRKSVGTEGGLLMIIREFMVIGAFGVLYIFIESLWQREQSPAKKLGFALVLTLVIGTASSLLFLISPSGFDVKNYSLIPLGYDSIIWANIYGVVLGITMLIVLLIMRDIIFSKRRRGTNRNFIIFVVLALATALSTVGSRPLETNIVHSIFFGLTVWAMLLNSFRLSWIVFLSKREKIYSIVYGFLLFCLFIGLDILTSKGIEIGKSVAFYSTPLQSFIATVSIFATIYFGMTFISTLFHLPTAEAFDRKISEVSSLHNLSRLVTQVFDFNELVESVTTMTLEVCEAKSSWLEIIQSGNSSPRGLRATFRADSDVTAVALKNISREDAESIMASHGDTFRRLILEGRKPVVIDSVKNDKRVERLTEVMNEFNSMAIVPLLSHDNVIGILYATKEVEYGFDRDDIEVISAFADQATIAIENSRLIEKSLERERLMREMMLAQDMQRKLLPQAVPSLKEVEIEALSTPAFVVGGDYYDFTMLD